MSSLSAECPLCQPSAGAPLLQTPLWRVVRVQEPGFPAFYRLIWQAHVAEFSELTAAERAGSMEAVAAIERVLIARLQPDKINLASFGNMVPHLHWHVMARFAWDSHYPQPLWGPAQRPADPAGLARIERELPALDMAVREALLGLA